MRHEKLKVGMVVRANSLSNEVYTYTTEENDCVGIVEKIEGGGFMLRVTEHKDTSKLGVDYCVEANYFDVVKENIGMIVELKKVENKLDIGYGDLLVFEYDKQVLVISDTDGMDYRGIVIGEYKPTSFKNNINSFLKMLSEEKGLGALIRVVKADRLKLSEI